jgi:putative ABC transport system permease protein
MTASHTPSLPRLPALAAKSALFHVRSHVLLFLLAALCSMILVGALVVGDSVRFSLRRAALLRLGPITHVFSGGSRYVDAALADRIARQGVPCAPLILLPGVALADTPEGPPRQVNKVQVIGADERFFRFTGGSDDLSAPGALINSRLAAALHLRPGMEISVRVPRPGLLPDDAPLASRRESAYARGRFTVRAILQEDHLGNFGIQTDQAEPYNVFLPIAWLQAELGRPAQANLLAAASPRGEVARALDVAWRPEDAGFLLGTNDAGCVLLQTTEVFLSPGVKAAVAAAAPDSVASFTYLVNSLSAGDPGAERSVPYSFVTALQPCASPNLGIVPADMGDDEVLLNRWAADAIRAGPGDAVTLRYSRIAPDGGLAETNRIFRVRGVVEMEQVRRERDLVPAFPGLSDVNSCRDWDIGMPLDEKALNDPRNEEYWEAYRQTPKAFVTWRSGREMWGSRFGEVTGIRFPASGDSSRAARKAITASVAGVGFVPVGDLALRAVEQSTDIGQLMLGMSAFLILAAVLLASLSVGFSLQQRAGHLGCLLAMGGQRRYLFALTALETLVASLCGAIAGVPAGVLYAKLMTLALGSAWSGAVAGAAVAFHARAGSVALGLAIALLAIAAAIAGSLRRLLRRSPLRLLTDDATQDDLPRPLAGRPSARRGAIVFALLAAAAVGLLVWAALAGNSDAEAYFLAGCGILAASLQGFSFCLARAARIDATPATLTLGGTIWRDLTRHRTRSMAVVAALACGSFIVLSVGSMQSSSAVDPTNRASGTGGFTWYAESTLPVLDAPATSRQGREQGAALALARFDAVSMKLRDGDHAGCLNLNRAQAPRVVGVPTGELSQRGSFASDSGATLWSLLDAPATDGALPALASDMDTLQWGLQLKAHPESGDILELTDERGRPQRVRIVGALPRRQTVLHGTLLVSRDTFQRLYPSEAGHRLFLMNPRRGESAFSTTQLDSLMRLGFDVQPSGERLAAFHRVEATYLRMFMLLGGLGMLLGAGGLGLVLLRNVTERRHELALLEAVGFQESRIGLLLGLEHAALLSAGLVIGCGAAAASMIPAARQAAGHVPWADIITLVASMLALGAGSILVALRAVARSRSIAATLSRDSE